MRARWTLLALLMALMASCNAVLMSSGAENAGTLQIDDGAHGGNPGFYFLPPLVPAPDVAGVWDGSHSPEVRICALDGAPCAEGAANHVVSFTGDDVVVEDDHYHVNWHTRRYALNPAVHYRISVAVDSTVLGFADVDLVARGDERRDVDGEQYLAVKDGRTLPVKFRIEEGAVAPPAPAAPAIEPNIGFSGTPFTITDPHGRMLGATLIVFTELFTAPETGSIVTDAVFSVDGTTATGTVPATAPGGIMFVTVHSTRVDDPPVFGGLFYCGGACIWPLSGWPGDSFTIYDASARMSGASFVVFTQEGGQTGVAVTDPLFEADGTRVRGTVPLAAGDGRNLVTIHRDSPDGGSPFGFAFRYCVEPCARITPHNGPSGSFFNIHDPGGRMGPEAIVVITPWGDPPETGTIIDPVLFNAAGTDAQGRIPDLPVGAYLLTVHPQSATEPPYFHTLQFDVVAP